MTVTQKVAAIQNSIELQKRTRKNIEDSRVACSEVDGMDVERMLATCDEIIMMLESRLDAIPRRTEKVRAASR